MSYLLHIDASSLSTASFSRQVAASFRDSWAGEVVYRDLAANPAPHLTAAGISARLTDPTQRTEEESDAAQTQDELVDEFLGAGAYLFTVPMYNYSMPSVFKAWIDQISIVGRTIVVPGGLPAAGRPAVVISARGGSYGPGTPNQGMDFLVPSLELILGPRTLGLDVSVITPELTLAPVVPQLARFIDLHKASMVESHAQAHGLAVGFAAA
jgi:FMN-dependent NADH-azoreductase